MVETWKRGHVGGEGACCGSVGRIREDFSQAGSDDVWRALVRSYPAPEAERFTRLAVYGWSAPIGMTTSGIPSDSASLALLNPPCVMKAAALSRTASCGQLLDPHVGRRPAEPGRVLVLTDGGHDLDPALPKPPR